MGYYSQIEMDVTIKPDKVEKFEKELKSLKEISAKERSHWFDWFNDIEIDDKGTLTLTEYNRKWYDPENLYDFLKDYVEDGSFIQGQGEEFGDIWRVIFKRGKYKEQVMGWKDADNWED